MPHDDEQDLVTMAELVEATGVNRDVIYAWIRAGHVDAATHQRMTGRPGRQPSLWPRRVIEQILSCKGKGVPKRR